MIHLQLLYLHIIPTTVGIPQSVWNEFLLQPETKSVILVRQSDIERFYLSITSVARHS